MARMLNLRNVFELVDDGFHDGPLAKEEFVHQRHEHIFHIGSNSGNELDVEGPEQFFTQLPGNVAFIGKQLAKQFSNHLGNGLAIIDIARCEQEIEQLASVIEDQVQFEAKKPTGGSLSALG